MFADDKAWITREKNLCGTAKKALLPRGAEAKEEDVER